MKGYIALTTQTTKCNEIAQQINKDHPNTAVVKNLMVYIPVKYMNECKVWVKKNCKLKAIEWGAV